MKYTRIFIFFLLSSFCSACLGQKNGLPSFMQGLYGQIIWMEGNAMPSPDRPNQVQRKGIQRTVYVFSLTKLKDTRGEAPLFNQINSNLIAKVKSDKNGKFKLKLPPGKYSLFTLDENGSYFANLFDGDGNINSFEIKENELTKMDMEINYRASF